MWIDTCGASHTRTLGAVKIEFLEMCWGTCQFAPACTSARHARTLGAVTLEFLDMCCRKCQFAPACTSARQKSRSDTRCGKNRVFGQSFVSGMVERSHALLKSGNLHHSTTSTREAIDGAVGKSSAVTSMRRRRRRATSIVACTRVRSSIRETRVRTVASSLERESRVSRRGRPRRGRRGGWF